MTGENRLYPLDGFYARAGLQLPAVALLPGEEVPRPYRQLLVHANDMTPTLEAFHSERIQLRLISREVDGGCLSREVVLVLCDSGLPVEFGAIAIHLEPFPPAARELILESRVPLGTILAMHQVEHSSHPDAFFRIDSDGLINEALGLTASRPLYGRRNVMTGTGGCVLAEVVEILPPLDPK